MKEKKKTKLPAMDEASPPERISADAIWTPAGWSAAESADGEAAPLEAWIEAPRLAFDPKRASSGAIGSDAVGEGEGEGEGEGGQR
jgi:hypothetical protein